ncbi:MAG: hypothetical protein K9I68_02065 [Bacteroidales bacterium]|nr:hypothetical protein [Bacteroidales bacterium]MCF8337037.1 hypothetical protein [Bacteroidales bacterium]
MNKFSLIIAGIFGALLFQSCETDFDVTAEWQDITIVYGLLNTNDSVHEIKINKAFLGDGSLIEYAANEDSALYENLDVKLQELNKDSTVIDEFPLDTTVIHNKDTAGAFFAPDQVIYTTGRDNKVFLDDDYLYRLKIYIPARDKTVTATTGLVYNNDNHFSEDNLTIDKPSLGGFGEPTIYFSMNEDFYQTVKWNTAKNGRRYQLEIHFRFQERTQNGDIKKRTITWSSFDLKQSRSSEGGETMEIRFPHTKFYKFVADNVPYENQEKEDEVSLRIAKKIDFEISVASDVFDTYMQIYEPSQGIVEYRPEFSNVENGMGLFASRTSKTRSFVPSINVKDILNEEYTLLKFQKVDN